jgi:hypothetical protein
MAEGRVADIVGKAERLRQILIDAQGARQRAADLRDLQAVGQANPEMIAIGRDEYLRLVPQPPERDRVDDAIPVALKGIARPARLAFDDRISRPRDRAGSDAYRADDLTWPPVARSPAPPGWSR